MSYLDKFLNLSNDELEIIKLGNANVAGHFRTVNGKKSWVKPHMMRYEVSVETKKTSALGYGPAKKIVDAPNLLSARVAARNHFDPHGKLGITKIHAKPLHRVEEWTPENAATPEQAIRHAELHGMDADDDNQPEHVLAMTESYTKYEMAHMLRELEENPPSYAINPKKPHKK